MTKPTRSGQNPDRAHPPGEVERDNDAHRADTPKNRTRDSTAQETAREVTPKTGQGPAR
jgi:hypothetical protein